MEGSFFASLGVWNWFLAAALLLVLEIFVPGTFMLWLGLAAALTGFLALTVDIGWQLQIVIFAVLALGSVVVGRSLIRRGAKPEGQPFLNQRAQALVGREFLLADPITEGSGRVRVDDTVWRVVGPDAPPGARVRVTGVEGSVLRVETV